MRSLNLDQLRAFVEVVERGSLTAAAKELNLTQPAVTHQLQELERRFQVSLVERFGKRAYLTQAGEKLIEHARNLLDEDSRAHVAMRRFGDGWLGRVRVGTSMTVLMYVLPPVLLFFFFNDTATTEIYTLSLHDALPIPPSPNWPPWKPPCPTSRCASAR